MKPQDGEGEVVEQRVQHRHKVGLGDALAASHQLELGDTVHRVDVIGALEPVEVPLMQAVDADESGRPWGLGGHTLEQTVA